MAQDISATYRTVQTVTADPATITTMLYDGAIKAVRKARIHLEATDRVRFAAEIERASLIVGELRAALDLDLGEIPAKLASLYSYCLRLLAEAALGDGTKLDEVEKHLTRVAAAWKDAVQQLRTAAPA
jgi:flagellar secretion chaperone FliS